MPVLPPPIPYSMAFFAREVEEAAVSVWDLDQAIGDGGTLGVSTREAWYPQPGDASPHRDYPSASVPAVWCVAINAGGRGDTLASDVFSFNLRIGVCTDMASYQSAFRGNQDVQSIAVLSIRKAIEENPTGFLASGAFVINPDGEWEDFEPEAREGHVSRYESTSVLPIDVLYSPRG